MFMYSRCSDDSETLLNMLLRIMEKKNRLSDYVFIDYGYDRADNFIKHHHL